MNISQVSINWKKVNDVILKAKKIMLTTHENPDGDGLGSECGIYYHLKEIGKDVKILNYSSLPSQYNFLNTDNIFEKFDLKVHEKWIIDVDLLIVFDVGDFSRTRTIADYVLKNKIQILNIDHHPHSNDHKFDHNYIDLNAAATGCMVYDYLKTNRSKPINKKSLEGIYTAVMTDTGSFKYSNTTEKCHKIAIECLKNNIKTHQIYQKIYENSPKSRVKLMGEFLSNIQYDLDGKLAWFVITQEMLSRANADQSDVEGFSDLVRSIRGVEVSVMIFEQTDLICRINFRSKGSITINDIAKKLGGGGHPLAAGAKIKGNLKYVKDHVISITKKMLDKKNIIVS
jgi:phosphoesterase RecJ-like protein